MDIVDCARLFALTSMAGNDAYIAVFDAKYTYNLSRPLTAIRNADQTNNSATLVTAHLPLGARPCIRSIRVRIALTRLQLPPFFKG